MRPARPLVFELFGTPGAGKTTLANAVMAACGVPGRSELSATWSHRSLLQKGASLARVLSQVDLLLLAARFAAANRLANVDSLSRLARLIAKTQRLRSWSGMIILSEGVLQDLWSILYSAGQVNPKARSLSPFIRAIYRGVDARIAYVVLDPKTASRRISERRGGHSRLDQLDEAALCAELTKTAELPRRIVEAAQFAGMQVEMIDGSAAIADNVDRLRRMMNRLPDQGSVARS